MKYLFFTTTFLLLNLNLAFGETVEKTKLVSSNGTDLVMNTHYPTSNQKALPVVVIAPGRGYHMDLPLIKSFAEKVSASGYIAIRFNWTYFGKENGNASDDLVKELRDYQAVVGFAKTNPRIDSSQIFVAGKSLGSIVSYRFFESEPAVKGLFLLTPICSAYYDDQDKKLPEPILSGDKHYPKLLVDSRPIVVVIGNRDPNCLLPMYYDFVKTAKSNIASLVLQGDHSLNVGKWDDPIFQKRNTENIDAATNIISYWVHTLVSNLEGI